MCNIVFVIELGPVVQSIVSLTTPLRRQFVNYNADYTIKYTVIFLTFFSNKKSQCTCICNVYFNERLTNDVVNFQQRVPGVHILTYHRLPEYFGHQNCCM